MVESKYMEFIEVRDTGKTKEFLVRSTHGGAALARISWYGRWRQYTMFPVSNTVWNPECLRNIIEFIEDLTAERKRDKQARATARAVADMNAWMP